MAVLKPFRGYRYSEEKFGKDRIGALFAPPYDVISERLQEKLRQDPLNIVHVTLGKTNGNYEKAARLFRSWIDRGEIIQEEKPAFYIYEQIYRLNPEDDVRVRTGFVGLVRLEEFEKKIIMPHEKTMPKYSLDRLELLKVTGGNLEQIFGIYNDASGEIERLLEKSKTEENLLIDFIDCQEIRHRIWSMTAAGDINTVRRVMNPRTLIIADGHHRYETSLMYRREIRKKLDDPLEEIPEDLVMMTLVNLKNPGLLVLPTHRLVHDLPVNTLEGFLDRCRTYCEVIPFSDQEAMENFLAGSPKRTFGVYIKPQNVWAALTLREVSVMDRLLGRENVNRYLDTSILHELILKKILGIDEDMQANNVDYLKGTKDVYAVAREDNHYQLVFVMKPTPIEDIEQAVAHAQRMPQKSSYFYPKVWTGLVMRLLEERAR
ncbi:MAG TPA: DUF1015 domain-containing protein [Atribacteraceae bacterium]|nr:DUF1015 domain-containing protein [Atribacteraceae bacterium]